LQVDDQHCSLIKASLGSLAALLFAEKAIRELCSQWIPDQLNNSCLLSDPLWIDCGRSERKETRGVYHRLRSPYRETTISNLLN
jgi:hypothetical protein